MNWWWFAAGWIVCGGIAFWAATYSFSSPWWIRALILVTGPVGLLFVMYVGLEMSSGGDR